MEKERSIVPILVVVMLIAGIVAGTWFVISSNRIVRGVPSEGATNRVILITPQSTPSIPPTSTPAEVEATDSASSNE